MNENNGKIKNIINKTVNALIAVFWISVIVVIIGLIVITSPVLAVSIAAFISQALRGD